MSRLDKLISELCPEGVAFRPLGEIGDLIRGRRFTKSDYVDVGLGSIHYGEVYTSYGTWANQVHSYVRPELRDRLRLARYGDLIIAATGESLEEVGKAVAWLGDEEIAIHDDCYIFRHTLDPKFVAYFFQSSSFHVQKARYATESKLARIPRSGLERVRMPEPPMPVQQAIVDLLTEMERLEAELRAELEAELKARRKQYEYYRDLLLTLPEQSA